MKRWEPVLFRNAYGDKAAGMVESPIGDYLRRADVEAANAWRYDDPEEDGWYLVSLLGGLVSTAFRTRAGWNRTDVLAWLPLPEPAKEKA